MAIKDFFDFGQPKLKAPEATWADKIHMASVTPQATYYGQEYIITTTLYDGEKTYGELGAPIKYTPAYKSLRARSWQMYLDNDTMKILIKGYVDWILGSGLKLEAEPIQRVIERSGYKFNKAEFTQTVEDIFKIYSYSPESSFNKMNCFHDVVEQAFISAVVGGDSLLIFRTEKYGVNIELIEGSHIETPSLSEVNRAKSEGNNIVHGVEIDSKGTHLRYWIAQHDGTFKSIDRVGKKTGRVQAVMLYGDQYRVDDVRGLPILAASLEKMKKIDRYIEAVVSSAEERAKIAYYAKHNHFSDGENPLAINIEESINTGEGKMSPTGNATIDQAAKQFATTTGKQFINMPIGSELAALSTSVELNQKEFVDGIFMYVAASIEFPYEMAKMLFTENYSASRMSSQIWDKKIATKRAKLTRKCHLPFYKLWMEWECLNGRLDAIGYTDAIVKDDIILKGAYTNARFVGSSVPQVDPVKEVEAAVIRIKNKLSTMEKETEFLGCGDFNSNVDNLSQEYALIKKQIPEEFIEIFNKMLENKAINQTTV